MYMSNTLHTASTECPECETTFERLPVERDEDGGYVLLAVTECPACAKLLCRACDQFECGECRRAFCLGHLVSVPGGYEPLRCCQACAEGFEPLDLPEPMAPGSERLAIAEAVA
jgi:hypothetical protein